VHMCSTFIILRLFEATSINIW